MTLEDKYGRKFKNYSEFVKHVSYLPNIECQNALALLEESTETFRNKKFSETETFWEHYAFNKQSLGIIGHATHMHQLKISKVESSEFQFVLGDEVAYILFTNEGFSINFNIQEVAISLYFRWDDSTIDSSDISDDEMICSNTHQKVILKDDVENGINIVVFLGEFRQ